MSEPTVSPRRLAVILLALMLLACEPADPLVTEAVDGTRAETRAISCEFAGFCPHYNFFAGKWEYTSWHCDGHREAEVQVSNVKRIYQSGRVEWGEAVAVTRTLSECR